MSEVIPVRIPQETVNDDQVLIQQWQVTDGQLVRTGQVLVEVETSKSVFEITCPADGYIRLNAASDQEVPIGKILCYIGDSLEAIDESLKSRVMGSNGTAAHGPRPTGNGVSESIISTPRNGTVALAVPTENSPTAHSTRFSQRALELIETHGLTTSDFVKRGLVRGEDVLRSLSTETAVLVADAEEETVASPVITSLSSLTFRSATGVPYQTEALARSKRVETKVLSWSTQQAIRSSVTMLVPTAGRHPLQDADPDAMEKVTAHLIGACAKLLRQFPRLNACCLQDQVLLYEQVHIGYALDAGSGLKVAVLRDADQRTVPDLISERQRLISAYLDQTLLPVDLSGGTFTITDLSGSGVTTFDPLISEGQAGILGISGEFPLGHNQRAFHLVLSFDHRLVEGRAATLFLTQLKEQIVQFERSITTAQPFRRSEPCCSRCGITSTQATLRNHFLVSTAGPQHESALICTVCLQGR